MDERLSRRRRCGHQERWTWMVLLFSMTVAEADDKFRCGPGITTPGVTIPSGDIVLEYGSPLEILCVLSPSVVSQGFNSSHLLFYHTSHQIMPELISLVNRSTARLYIEKPVPMNDMFYCKLANGTEETPVCLNTVAVGSKPQEVLNFSCVSYNWDNLNCSWTPPMNYVKTKYTLVYQLPGRAGGRLKYPCPNDTDVKGKNYCLWDQTTATPYRQPYEYYYFVMTGENRFSTITTKIRFHHYAHVIPAKAANLTVKERTSHSAKIQWSVVFPMQTFPPGVTQKVEYQSQWDDRDYWQVVNTISLNPKNATHELNITDLKYANSLYDIRVFMKSPYAIGDQMWSQPATVTIRTFPTIPGAAPKTDLGSFEVITGGLTTRDIYVYWQRIPEHLANGEAFGYQVTVEVDGVLRENLKPNETTSAYAIFRGLSLSSYRFRIVSINEVGTSEDFSEVFVPSQKESLSEPQSFTKIAFDHHIYELSWKPPVAHHQISSYTIFWCDNNKDRPYQCTGTLNWTRVSRDEVIKNITVPDEKIYQFAISANTETGSSGMVWASCTVIHNRILGKMKSIWINRIGSTYIEVGWKLECSDRIGMVTGFQISYCPIVSPHNLTCKVEAKNTTINGDSMTIRGNVTNLTPYTTYMVMVAVITRNSVGQWSDRQYNTTMEAAPGMPPQHVKITEKTNTSIRVEWAPPTSMNGVLRYYEVYYNNQKLKVEVDKSQNNHPQVVIAGLDSYKEFNVSVKACTVTCSAPSPAIEVLTEIGKPGKIERPLVRFFNESIVEVMWKKPDKPGGEVNEYQVKVEVSDDQENMTAPQILNCTGSQQKMLIPMDCETVGPHNSYLFSVRAINYAKDVHHIGPWSDPDEGPCFKRGPGSDFYVILSVIFCLFALAMVLVFVFLGKRLWESYKHMKDVQIELPPGLAPTIEKNSDPDYRSHLNLYGWTPPPTSEKEESSQPDQERLLRKKSESGDGGSLGESSGCSSGHESVASSLTAGTHISSDSGTEADQPDQSGSLDGVFLGSLSGSGGLSSLRQRNKTSTEDSGSSSGRWEPQYVMLGGTLINSTPNLSEMDADKTGYCMLGGTGSGIGSGRTKTTTKPSMTTAATSGYVTLPPSASLPPAYLPHPAWSKEADESPQPPAKGYVMAGEGKEAEPSQYCRLDYVPRSDPTPTL